MKAYFLPGISYEINLFLVYFQIIFLSQHPNDLCTVEFLNSNFPTAPYDYFHRGLPILVQLNFLILAFQPPHIPIFTGFHLHLYSWIPQFTLSNRPRLISNQLPFSLIPLFSAIFPFYPLATGLPVYLLATSLCIGFPI